MREDLLSLISAEKESFGVAMMCELLGIARSSYYAWEAAAATRRRSDPWAEARAMVERFWLEHCRRPGARTIHACLGVPGLTLYRVRKLMRELGIRGVHPRTSKRTTVPDPDAPARPDLIRRDFESPVPTVKLVGDITYLRTGEGWLYMAAVIDLCTRMVVGLSFSDRMTADLPIAALETAYGRGFVADGAIFHSDRGSQYTSKAMADWAGDHGVRLSVGRTGSCHDNAVAESFFGTFKNEMYHLRAFATRDEARMAAVEYVEGYYNRRRPHSTIGYRIPAEVMDGFFARFEEMLAREARQPLAA